MDQLLRIKQAAELLNVSDKVVRRLVNEGKIRACKIGGQIRIRPTDLDTYVSCTTLPMAAGAPRRRGRPPQTASFSGGRSGYYPGMKVV